jgi:hypothetical protein
MQNLLSINEMEAGREMDALVAENVMGWKPHKVISCPFNKEGCLVYHYEGDWRPNWKDIVPNYSTDIKDAWKVVEKMDAGGYSLDITRYPNEKCRVNFHIPFSSRLKDNVTAEGKEFPLAICRAALLAVAE